MLRRHLQCRTTKQMLNRLHVDYVVTVSPQYIGPRLRRLTEAFGCRYTHVDYGSGVYREVVFHPLAQYTTVEEIERYYTWPDPDWWDYSQIPQDIKGHEKYPIRGGGSEPFNRYCKLRGQESQHSI